MLLFFKKMAVLPRVLLKAGLRPSGPGPPACNSPEARQPGSPVHVHAQASGLGVQNGRR